MAGSVEKVEVAWMTGDARPRPRLRRWRTAPPSEAGTWAPLTTNMAKGT